MSRRPLVIVFARVPQLGRVKTRLARGIGAGAALGVYRAMLATTLRRLVQDRRFDLRIAATPSGASRRRFGRLPARVELVPQVPGHLGRRMLAALRAAGRRPSVVVGCDIPELDAAAVAEALRALSTGDVVLGPSRDGGYWLIGWRGTAPGLRLLDGVRWSTAFTRADTEACLGLRRLRLGRMLDDVDEAGDLARLRPSLSASR
jgi:rSAM/selenodomain-associated transferase 1